MIRIIYNAICSLQSVQQLLVKFSNFVSTAVRAGASLLGLDCK